MLSYQHSYHAGNFADVVKHLVLCSILEYMNQKEKPYLYLETHAGRGVYDLTHAHSMKTVEYKTGIALLWEARHKAPHIFSSYLENIRSLNSDDELRFYPGSPLIAVSTIRASDRLILSEKHPTEFSYLEKLPKKGKRVFVEHTDGIKSMLAALPPIERRGLVFIDPSFEVKEEYKTIPAAISQAYKRFATGVYCLWYPIIDNRPPRSLTTAMVNIKSTKMLQIEFNLNHRKHGQGNALGMDGCGLWIINPPYQLEAELRRGLDFLCKIFNPGLSSYTINS